MSVRRAALARKTVVADTGWKRGAVQPRHAPIFLKTKPLNERWLWRSLKIKSAEADCVLYLQISPDFGKWQAFLIAPHQGGHACLVRIEDQPGAQPGFHVHAHCSQEPLAGPQSIGMPDRFPRHGSECRRRGISWTASTFLEACCILLRVSLDDLEHRQGDLFDDA